jgi:hypothetical protein
MKRLHDQTDYPASPYFWTRASYERPADIIVFWYARTPTGRISKYWTTHTFCADALGRWTAGTIAERIARHTFPKLPRGYRWSEPLQYSGDVDLSEV